MPDPRGAGLHLAFQFLFGQSERWSLVGLQRSNSGPYTFIKELGNLGTWELGNLGTWELVNLGTWELGNLGTWELGNLGAWKLGNLGTLELLNFGTWELGEKNFI